MFKNPKTMIIILAVLIVGIIAILPSFGNTAKEIKDTNGEDNFSLCEISDEDIIKGMEDSGISSISDSDDKYHYVGKAFNGVTTLGTDEPLNSYDKLEIKTVKATKGNLRLLILSDNHIIHDFTINQPNQTYSIDESQGDISLIVAGESANFEVVFTVS